MEIDSTEVARLYAELSDEHLLDLAGDTGTLTGTGRMALAAELASRGLTPQVARGTIVPPAPAIELEQGFGPGIPGVFPGGAVAVEQALEPRTETARGMSSLILFYDGHELSRACDLLGEANLDPVIEPIAGDALNGVPPAYEVWVPAPQLEVARQALRAGMALFPLAEVESTGQEGDGVVGLFESRAEAEQIVANLNVHGLTARASEQADEGIDRQWVVTVAPVDQERALAAVAAMLGIG